ncbi:MraY family glycosyltransferase [Allobaculum stercoricanis]|uniref:MraY family glycosyltransferase n=1 Tax=Allobaculum stercoricanis TaxID=174709 RepID=UPI00036297A5|nr:MraY family glycosyltransferase [Allobaculum stercoricanis]
METLLAFVVPFCLSTLLIPLVKKVSIKTEAWAKQNERTIHHGIISRIGGIAIFIAFSVGLALFFKADRSILGIYLASSLMFLIGLWDDFLDLPAKFKFLLQVGCAMILLVFGVRVDTLRVLGVPITNTMITSIFTILWVVGITNAINFLDGLDGLCGGMILVVLSVVCSISIVDQRGDIVLLSLIMMGSILGFLLYNSHPASIFMGDCGSLFLGCMIASISLLGFKSSTMMTLSFPILILILPIIDTFSAILRRKIKHIPFDQADRSHLHHQLMARFGQTTSVLIMCAITFGFGMSAFVYIHDRRIGMLLMFILMLGIELFIERTGMISPSFHPIHSLFRGIFKPFFKNRPAWYEEDEEVDQEIAKLENELKEQELIKELAQDKASHEIELAGYQEGLNNNPHLSLDANDTQASFAMDRTLEYPNTTANPDNGPDLDSSIPNAENVAEYLASFTMTPQEQSELEQFKQRPASEFFNQSAFQADPTTILENMRLNQDSKQNANSNQQMQESSKQVAFVQTTKSNSAQSEFQVIQPRLFAFDADGILEEDLYHHDSSSQMPTSTKSVDTHDKMDQTKQSDSTSQNDVEEVVYPSALSAFSLAESSLEDEAQESK